MAKAKADSARYPYTAADLRFMSGMIGHHAQAIVMADRLFLSFKIQHHAGAVSMVKELFDSEGAGQDQTVFKFASDVNVDQSTEIARMEKMLTALSTTPQ